MSEIIVYGRGFLGFSNGMDSDEDQNFDIKKQAAIVRYQKPASTLKGYGVFNKSVDKLYNQLTRQERDLTSLTYRRAILMEAIRAFGTYSFKDWCQMQANSYYFTDNHRKFLEDTLRFIATGERLYGFRAWEFTLCQENASYQSKKFPFDYDTYFNSFRDSLGITDHSTLNTIQRWVSQPKGFEDMVTSLHLIFGKTEKKIKDSK